MIARGFKPVGWVAAVATAALGCYMLSLNVASERAELSSVEQQIVLAKRDIRALQTELGTRGRLQQLEHWNADVLALSAPASGQFVQDEFILARYTQPEKSFEERAKVQMASAETVAGQPAVKPAVERGFASAPADLGKPVIRRASLEVGTPMPFTPVNAPAPKSPKVKLPVPKAPMVKLAEVKAAAAKPAAKAPVAKVAAVEPAAAKTQPKAPAKASAKAAGRLPVNLAQEITEAAKAEKTSGGSAAR